METTLSDILLSWESDLGVNNNSLIEEWIGTRSKGTCVCIKKVTFEMCVGWMYDQSIGIVRRNDNAFFAFFIFNFPFPFLFNLCKCCFSEKLLLTYITSKSINQLRSNHQKMKSIPHRIAKSNPRPPRRPRRLCSHLRQEAALWSR